MKTRDRIKPSRDNTKAWKFKPEPNEYTSDDESLMTVRNNMKINTTNMSNRHQQNNMTKAFNLAHNSLPPLEGYSLCCCCLELPCLKDLWTDYSWMGQVDTYGDIMKDCFDIVYPPSLRPQLRICSVCITRLRDANSFKNQVLACRNTLLQKCIAVNDIKWEKMVHVGNKLIEECNENGLNHEQSESDIDEDTNDKGDIEFDSFEQLEHKGDKDELQHDAQVAISVKHQVIQDSCVIRKGIRRLKPGVKRCDRRTGLRTDHIRPRQNIGLLLQHTTILPFKSNKGYFNCFYCNKQFIVVEDLRRHVSETHANVTVLDIIKHILRPHDRIKADISDITCKICSYKCQSVADVVDHLQTHDIKFNYDDKVIKPTDCLLAYDLKDGKFTCVVCRAEFHFFQPLTKHMNEHSTNFICDVCGRCFLLAERLKAHIQVHTSSGNGYVNCEICGKLCATVVILRSHKRHHHKKRSHCCGICNESFSTYRQRMQHLEDVHNRLPLDLSCKICSKNFKTTSHLGCHMRTEHFNIPYVRKRKKKEGS